MTTEEQEVELLRYVAELLTPDFMTWCENQKAEEATQLGDTG